MRRPANNELKTCQANEKQMQKEYLMESDDVLAKLETSHQGLTDTQVAERQSKYGMNKLTEGKKESLFRKFLKELTNFMTIILIVAAFISGATSLYVGESMIDTFIILLVVNYLSRKYAKESLW